MLRILFLSFCFIYSSVTFASAQHRHATSAPTHVPPKSLNALPEWCYNEKNQKFSHYGWCHEEMHALGWIQELIRQTNNNCCDGGHGGECRLSRVDRVKRTVLINGEWFAYSDDKWGPKYGFIEPLKPGYAIVCSNARIPYCIGTTSGQ